MEKREEGKKDTKLIYKKKSDLFHPSKKIKKEMDGRKEISHEE